MGQESSNPAFSKPSKEFEQEPTSPVNTKKQTTEHLNDYILKISLSPFSGCEKTEFEGKVYYLEAGNSNVKELIKSRSRLKQKFEETEVIQIIENISNALSYLESVNTPYPDLSLHNIFYSHKRFKILPVAALKNDIYTKLKQCINSKKHEYMPASPELIIAARYKQPQIRKKEILFKSNIFAFGLALLEICTLKSSSECYDLETYDILDSIVTAKVEEIEKKYSQNIARIIASMLHYDSDERMGPKSLSIWIKNELNKVGESLTFNRKKERFVAEREEKLIGNSRKLNEDESGNSTKKNMEKELQEHEKSRSMKVSEKRMSEIREKINKEKKTSKIATFNHHKWSPNSALSKSPSFVEKEKTRKKYLPNPYLNQGHLSFSPRNSSPNCIKGNVERSCKYEEENSPSYSQRSRYQYQEERNLCSRETNLKYRYNYIPEEQLKKTENSENFYEELSPRKTNSLRDKNTKKHHIPNPYEERHENNQKSNSTKNEEELSSSDKGSVIEKNVVSEFSFESHKKNSTPKINYHQNERVLERYKCSNLDNISDKENNEEKTNLQSMFKQSKKLKRNPYEDETERYEKHQNLFENDCKEKRVKKEKESNKIERIKQEIQNSRKIIEEVQKLEGNL